MANHRPKIGLALSGGSGRAIAHIGVLEVLNEHDIPIDYITACSSGAIIAGSFSCGTMENLKQEWLRFDRKFLLNLLNLDKSGKGIFSTDKAFLWLRTLINKNFEEVKPQLGFVCVDILTGRPELLCLGDIVKASQASCAVPGLIEPVEWGNKLLVDGGLYSIVPTSYAKDMGADIVIGVDIASTRYIFSKKYYRVFQGYNFLRKSFAGRIYARLHDVLSKFFTKSINFIYYNQSDVLEEANLYDIGVLSILDKAVEMAVRQNNKRGKFFPDCDYMISPEVKKLGKMDLKSSTAMYEEGRRTALEAIPEIKKLIKDYQWRKKAEIKLKEYAR